MQDPMQGGMASLEGPGPGMEKYSLENMSEEDIQKMVDLGLIDENMAENARQMQTAEKLRYSEAPGMRGNSRVMTAANPMEFIGRGIQQYRAGRQMEDLAKQRGELGKQQTAGRRNYWDVLRGMRQKPIDMSNIEAPKVDLGEY
jgi:hypothetical protein